MSRAVGNALHKNPDPEHIPCYRVVNAKGELAEAFVFGGVNMQEKLLEADGWIWKNMEFKPRQIEKRERKRSHLEL